jgi:hypothetical protein
MGWGGERAPSDAARAAGGGAGLSRVVFEAAKSAVLAHIPPDVQQHDAQQKQQ